MSPVDPGGVGAAPVSAHTGRVAVIGDVAGHLDELQAELLRLGADATTGHLPEDLTVVQVGDLVHRGPDSDGVIALVDRYLEEQPTQWIQLVGNHEAQYLREPAFEWPERIGAAAAATLRRWWETGQLRAAVALRTPTEAFLVTHAGLTAGFWRTVLLAPTRAEDAAAALDSLRGRHDDVLFAAGQMLRATRRPALVGPTWAATATELVPSWLGTRMPFSQVHGHASTYDWAHRRFRAPAAIIALTDIDEAAKHETVTLPGGRIVGIDPGHGRRPRTPWRAWESMLGPCRGGQA